MLNAANPWAQKETLVVQIVVQIVLHVLDRAFTGGHVS